MAERDPSRMNEAKGTVIEDEPKGAKAAAENAGNPRSRALARVPRAITSRTRAARPASVRTRTTSKTAALTARPTRRA